MTGLYIGRFQPLHLGHLDAIKQALEQCDFLIIAVGSSQKSRETQNPFTANERIKMIRAALDEKNISRKKYCIVKVTDINNNLHWPKHVAKNVPQFEIIFTGSRIVSKLFRYENKLRKKPYKIIIIKKTIKISSTKIRAAMAKKRPWTTMVPRSAAKILYAHRNKLVGFGTNTFNNTADRH